MFAALAIARYIHNATGASIKHVISTLQPIQDMTRTINGIPYTATDHITDTATTILTRLATTPGHSTCTSQARHRLNPDSTRKPAAQPVAACSRSG